MDELNRDQEQQQDELDEETLLQMEPLTPEQQEELLQLDLSDVYFRIVNTVINAHIADGMKIFVYPIYGSDIRNGVTEQEQIDRAGTETAVYNGLLAASKEDISQCCWQGLLQRSRDENPIKLFMFPVPMLPPGKPQTEKEKAAAAADALAYAKSLSGKVPDAYSRMYLWGTYCQLQYGEPQPWTDEISYAIQYSSTEQAIQEEEREEELLLQQFKDFSPGISAAALAKKDIPPTGWIWNGMLQNKGVGVLAGDPKSGKSFFALQLGIHAARGDRFLDWDTNKTDVLYIDIDHPSESRTQQRIREIAGTEDVPENFIYFTPERKGIPFPTLDDKPGTLDALKYLLTYHKKRGLDIRFIVIDVYAAILPQGGHRDLDAYRAGRQEMKHLVKFAADNELFVLLIHHLNKSRNDSNPYSRITGSNALYSSVDAGIILTRSVKDPKTTMFIEGSDQEPGEHLLQFNKGIFEYLGTAEDYNRSYAEDMYLQHPIRQAITYLTAAGTVTGNMQALKTYFMERSGRDLPYEPKQIADFVKNHEQQLRDRDGIEFAYAPHGRIYTFKRVQPQDMNNRELNKIIPLA